MKSLVQIRIKASNVKEGLPAKKLGVFIYDFFQTCSWCRSQGVSSNC